MFFVLMFIILIAAPSPTTAPGPTAVSRRDRYKTFTFPRTPKISEDELIIKDMSTFVHNHSLGSPSGNKTFLRLYPHYHETEGHKPAKYNGMMFDLMKQALYATQDRLKYLQGILEKYQDDVCFRVGYVFAKLDQLLYDMKRIYTYAVKKYDYRTVKNNIIFYKHLTKKNIDITYIVEYMFKFHDTNVKALEELFKQVQKT